MTRNRAPFGLAVMVLVVAAIVPISASAQSGISLSPFEQNITFQPADTAKNFDVTLANNTTTVQELDLSVHDFGSLNDTGGILLEGSNDYSQHYGLASWMSLSTDTVVLSPLETRKVSVTVSNRDSLQTGGHYGAVVARVNSLNDQTGNRVVINQQLVSLVLVDKVGGERYDLKLDSISQNGNWLHLPTTVRLRFQNPGNVHVIPRGVVQLLSTSGTVIAQGPINTESAFVLPESYRELYVPLTSISKPSVRPGLYHIQVIYRYEGITASAHKQFVVRYLNLLSYVVVGLVAGAAWWSWRHRKLFRKRPR